MGEAYEDKVRFLIDTAARVCRKYGAGYDWTEWEDLRDAIRALDPEIRVVVDISEDSADE